jgi:hypothetical protein
LPASPNQINVHHKLNAQSNSAINRIHFLHGNWCHWSNINLKVTPWHAYGSTEERRR